MINIKSLWTNQAEMLFILGICPLLAITTNTIIGFSLGIIYSITIVLSCTIISLLKSLIPLELRFPVIIIVASTITSLISLAAQYWFYSLAEVLGVYISLIAVNCIILAFAEEVSCRSTALYSFLHSVRISVGILLLFVITGILRELIGYGTILYQAGLLFGELADSWTIKLFDDFSLILIKQTPGVFLVLGLIVAGINYIIKKDRSDDNLTRA